MNPFTDEELRDLLLYHGYAVPMVVLRTWGCSKNGKRRNRRQLVEAWIHYREHHAHCHFSAFPDFLSAFSIERRAKMPKIEETPPKLLPRLMLP